MALSDLDALRVMFDVAVDVVLTNPDFVKILDAIKDSARDTSRAPALAWMDAGHYKVQATPDSPATALMSGFPNILNPGAFVHGGLSNDSLYQCTTNAGGNLTSTIWGDKQNNQWYAIYALGLESGLFNLKAMPWLRVKSQASKTIRLGTLLDPSTGLGYGFATDELAGGLLYVISGAAAGLAREITGNNNDSGTGGEITYTGNALTLAEGNWFIVLPAANFRWIGDIFVDDGGDIPEFNQRGTWILLPVGHTITTPTDGSDLEDIRACPPLARAFFPYLNSTDSLSDPIFSNPVNLFDLETPFMVCLGNVSGDGTGVMILSHYSTVGLPTSFCRYKGEVVTPVTWHLKSLGWKY